MSWHDHVFEDECESRDRCYADTKYGKTYSTPMTVNKNHYHKDFEFNSIQIETEKAYLFDVYDKGFCWIAKKLIRHLDKGKGECLVWKGATLKYLDNSSGREVNE